MKKDRSEMGISLRSYFVLGGGRDDGDDGDFGDFGDDS